MLAAYADLLGRPTLACPRGANDHCFIHSDRREQGRDILLR
jgi:hypothetical protein